MPAVTVSSNLENFPFIEANFDAITNYELLCLIVKYLNNVIYNQNQVQDLSTELVSAYNELLNYNLVENGFAFIKYVDSKKLIYLNDLYKAEKYAIEYDINYKYY